MFPKCEWKLKGDPAVDICFTITRELTAMFRQKLPDLADLRPFKNPFIAHYHVDKNWIAVRIAEQYDQGVPSFKAFSEEDVVDLKSEIEPFRPRSHKELVKKFGPKWFGVDRFTYIGPYEAPYACWQDLAGHLNIWLSFLIFPYIMELNKRRVERAIPNPPQYNIDAIMKTCWVLECEKTCKQGTAFFLQGVGLVSCQHVLGEETKAFSPTDVSNKYPVKILKQNEALDLAIMDIGSAPENGLQSGKSDEIKIMDHLGIGGFPNYQFGDSGIFTPGLVVGFRTVSSIRRILTNAPIIAGMSGGPVINSNNKLIGVAVTGAECMEDAQETEKHGIIPIESLKFL